MTHHPVILRICVRSSLSTCPQPLAVAYFFPITNIACRNSSFRLVGRSLSFVKGQWIPRRPNAVCKPTVNLANLRLSPRRQALAALYLLGSLLDPEDGDRMLLRKYGRLLPDCPASHAVLLIRFNSPCLSTDSFLTFHTSGKCFT